MAWHPDRPGPILGATRNTEPPLAFSGFGFYDSPTLTVPYYASQQRDGRSSTAQLCCLKHLVSDGSELPDLTLHRGSVAVPEYNNLDLIHVVYPTSFPAGTGGFDIPDWACHASKLVASQASFGLSLIARNRRTSARGYRVGKGLSWTYRNTSTPLLHASLDPKPQRCSCVTKSGATANSSIFPMCT